MSVYFVHTRAGEFADLEENVVRKKLCEMSNVGRRLESKFMD